MSNAITMYLATSKTITFSGNTYAYRHLIKAVPGATWNKTTRRWEIPLENAGDARRVIAGLQVSKEVVAAYNELLSRREAALKAKDTDLETLPINGIKAPNGWTPRSYQNAGVAFLDSLTEGEGGILAFDMGLGKSLSALMAFQKWVNDGVADYMLVVCPSPLRYATWAKEIKQWTDFDFTVVDGEKTEEVEYTDGTKEKLFGRELRAAQYQQYLFGSRIIVMNYELFLHDATETLVANREIQTANAKAVVKERNRLKKLGWDKPTIDGEIENFRATLPEVPMEKAPPIIPKLNSRWVVTLDECQRIKNPKADTSKLLINSCKKAGRKILASGTPLENNIMELWQLVDFCREGLLGNFFKYKQRYMETDFFGRPSIPNPQMMPELREKIAPIMIRRTKTEAMPELPPLIGPLEHWVKMTDAQAKLYKSVRDGILEDMKSGEFSYLEVLAQITRMQQVADSPALLKDVVNNPDLPEDSGKLQELMRIVEDIDWKANKFIVFSQYKEMTDIIVSWLRGVIPDERMRYIHGGMGPQVYEEVQTSFNEGDVQCIVLTTAGNYGLDLWGGSYVIAYDCHFNPQKMNQIYSRCHRSGVKSAVTAINLFTENTYEERKVKMLEAKRSLFSAMVDDSDEAFVKLFTKQDLIDMI